MPYSVVTAQQACSTEMVKSSNHVLCSGSVDMIPGLDVGTSPVFGT